MSEEKLEIEQVLVTIMQMVQYYTNHINYEMLRILCDNELCSKYVDMCLLCKAKEQAAIEAQQTSLNDFSEEE